MMKRQTIAIDIDDVLSVSAAGFSAYSNKRWGLSTKPEEYTEEWAVFWGIPLEDARKMAEEFHQSDTVYYYEHFEEALPVLRRLKKHYKLVAVTSRRLSFKKLTDQWMAERFPGIFESVHYAGIWDTDVHVERKLKQTKADICRELGADYLIDDQPKHCIAAQEAGLQALLFGNYHWNHGQATRGIVRVADWGKVEEYFNAKG